MAGNFWKSSHYEQWILDKHELLRQRSDDLKHFSEEEYQKLMIFFSNYIQIIGQEVGKVRMQVTASAIVYFRRFYARRSFKDIDPFLLAPTCIFLASKVEEHGQMSVNKISQLATNIWKRFGEKPFPVQDLTVRTAAIYEAEFCLLEILDCCLIVYHPYRPLNQLILDIKQNLKDFKDVDSLASDAWRVCNDSLRTDVAILYPPHQIAIACIMIAAILNNKEKDLKNWFAELSVDFEKVFEIQQMIFNMYRIWKSFEGKNFDEQLLALFEKLQYVRPQATIPPALHQQGGHHMDMQMH
uniref:Cyclin-like domain-containing protein n=1 Tax=Acrobeloides nanus TaxID=290746 RepID=A0A914EAM0_9BILA